MSVAIRIESVSKLYRLGTVGTGTLAHDLNRWWHTIRGKEDPYTKVGQLNKREEAADSEYVWALKDINLDVQQGEVLGIIGANGAGKSTLLKIISRITLPSTGAIKAKGRIASLLEVGTGMNEEMTARENIFLNGSILGMRRHEIAKKFDDIIDFAGCRMYVDTPVKRYSSGMRVRLGFAVAAFLEPKILIVDEVLAVGDAEFQDRALGKIQEVSESGGRTILFVSHHLDSVRRICQSAVLMQNGQIKTIGKTESVIIEYLHGQSRKDSRKVQVNGGACVDIDMLIDGVSPCSYRIWNLDQAVLISVTTRFAIPARCPRLDLTFYRTDGTRLATLRSDQVMIEARSDLSSQWTFNLKIEQAGLNCCDGYLDIGVSEQSGRQYSIIWKNAWSFQASSVRFRGVLPASVAGVVASCSIASTSN